MTEAQDSQKRRIATDLSMGRDKTVSVVARAAESGVMIVDDISEELSAEELARAWIAVHRMVKAQWYRQMRIGVFQSRFHAGHILEEEGK